MLHSAAQHSLDALPSQQRHQASSRAAGTGAIVCTQSVQSGRLGHALASTGGPTAASSAAVLLAAVLAVLATSSGFHARSSSGRTGCGCLHVIRQCAVAPYVTHWCTVTAALTCRCHSTPACVTHPRLILWPLLRVTTHSWHLTQRYAAVLGLPGTSRSGSSPVRLLHSGKS